LNNYRNQTNAKIDGLHHKYECYKTVSEKIDNLLILSNSKVITLENLDKFCDLLLDIQLSFSREFTFIKQPKNVSKVVS
jgi:hypothetical protein